MASKQSNVSKLRTQPQLNCDGAIRTCEVRLFKRLKEGARLDDAVAQFIGELRLALDSIVMNP